MQRQPFQKLRFNLVIVLYVGWLVSGAVQALMPNSAALYYLYSLIMSAAASWWLVIDASSRGKPVLHILQIFVFWFWMIVLPIYLIATRGLQGLGWLAINVCGLLAALWIGFFAMVWLAY